MRLRYKAAILFMGPLMIVTLAGLACGGSSESSTDTPVPGPTETLPPGNTVPPTTTATTEPDRETSTTSPEVRQTPLPTVAEEQPVATATPGAQSETTPQQTPEEARPTSTPQPTAQTELTPQPTPTIAEAQPTSTPQSPTPTPSPTPLASLGLFLQVTGVDSESVVHNNTVTISGVTSPDAVLSINGILVPINEEGEFEVTLSLDPGANLIEVIASDFEGNEESAVLAIISIPEEA